MDLFIRLSKSDKKIADIIFFELADITLMACANNSYKVSERLLYLHLLIEEGLVALKKSKDIQPGDVSGKLLKSLRNRLHATADNVGEALCLFTMEFTNNNKKKASALMAYINFLVALEKVVVIKKDQK